MLSLSIRLGLREGEGPDAISVKTFPALFGAVAVLSRNENNRKMSLNPGEKKGLPC